jgi:hypothetical protein
MKRKRDESLHLLDLPLEVLAMILCLFSRPWSSVLRMVCRQFAQVLELNKLGRLDYNDDESRYTNLEYGCLGTEMPGTLGLSWWRLDSMKT